MPRRQRLRGGVGHAAALRDSPLNSIWEGSGNVAALDVLRATVKEPEGLPAFLAECELARGADARLDAHLDRLSAAGRRRPGVRGAPPGRATWRWRSRPACWCATRRRPWPTRSAPAGSASGGRVFGTLPAGVDAGAIVERALADLIRRPA